MKYLILTFFVFVSHVRVQTPIYGEVSYLVSLNKNDFKEVKSGDSQTSNKVNDLITNSHDVHFILTFNQYESNFQKDNVLKSDVETGINLTEIMAGNNNIYYHNSKNNTSIMAMNIGGEDFLISKPKNEWQLINETKKIGDFICYKALLKNNTNNVIAWYTPSIPVNHGPNSFNGLPGLILELRNNKLIFVADKINLKPEEHTNIPRPNNGIELTYQEFKKKFGSVLDQ